MRQHNQQKEAITKEIEDKCTGQNYEKTRSKNVKPPGFVEKERKKRKLLIYVDVNITPTK